MNNNENKHAASQPPTHKRAPCHYGTSTKLTVNLKRVLLLSGLATLSGIVSASALAGIPAVSSNAHVPASTGAGNTTATNVSFQLPPYSPTSTRVIKGPNDPSSYRALTLPNGLKILLVHNPRADRLAAAVCVDTGSSFEPGDVPGLAHFNEHMLFLGTDRYPRPTAYQDWLGQHGGQFNAYTADRVTNYFVEIDPALGSEALNRLSRFFIAPRFNADYVNHERHAVDAEYHMGLRDSYWRLTEAIGMALNPAHPFTEFAVGNLDTLKDGKVPLRQRLIDFYQQHYSANLMQLAVVGPQSLDELQQMVESRFNQVPNRKLAKPSITTPLFNPGQLPATLEVTSLEQGQSVSFQFPVPDPALYPRSQPAHYIAELLGDQGKGSLLAALRHQGWATGLEVGSPRNDGHQALLQVDIDLTPEGAHQLDTIQATLFAYIQKIREGVKDKWRFDEQATLLNQQFAYLQPGSGMERASALSEAMSYLPVSEVNSAYYRMDQYAPAIIEHYLDQLTPANLLRIYQSPDVKGSETTRWYHTPYTLAQVKQWPAAAPLNGLALPAPNRFIARDFTLEPLNDHRPRRIVNQPGMDLWYQGNSTFGTPSAHWDIALLSPLTSQRPRNQVLTMLLANWIKDSQDEQLYPARLAGQISRVQTDMRGITLTLSGWRNQQGKVLEAIVKQLEQGSIDKVTFEHIRQTAINRLKNRVQQPLYHTLNQTMRERVLSPVTKSDKWQQQLEQISLDDLRAFRTQWLKQLHVQALVVGNLSARQAQDEAHAISTGIKPRLALSAIPQIKALQLPADLPELRPHSDSSDSGKLEVHTGPDRQLATQARWMALSQVMRAPFYSELRTQQQLGYVVGTYYASIKKVPALAMLVQSPGHDSHYLSQRMAAFVTQFGTQIEALKEQDLRAYQAAVISGLKQRPQSLDALAQRQWQQLGDQYLGFDHQRQLILAVEQLKVTDIQKAWQEFTHSPTLRIVSDKGVPANSDDYTALDKASVVKD